MKKNSFWKFNFFSNRKKKKRKRSRIASVVDTIKKIINIITRKGKPTFFGISSRRGTFKNIFKRKNVKFKPHGDGFVSRPHGDGNVGVFQPPKPGTTKGVNNVIRRPGKGKGINIPPWTGVVIPPYQPPHIKKFEKFMKRKIVIGKALTKNEIYNIFSQKVWKDILKHNDLGLYKNSKGVTTIQTTSQIDVWSKKIGFNPADLRNILSSKKAVDGKNYLKDILNKDTGYVQVGGVRWYNKAIKDADKSSKFDRKIDTFHRFITDKNQLEKYNKQLKKENVDKYIKSLDWFNKTSCISNQRKRELVQQHLLESLGRGSLQNFLYDRYGNQYTIATPEDGIEKVVLTKENSMYRDFLVNEGVGKSVEISDDELFKLQQQHSKHSGGFTLLGKKQFVEFLSNQNSDEIFNDECKDKIEMWDAINSDKFLRKSDMFYDEKSGSNDFNEEDFKIDIMMSVINNQVLTSKSKVKSIMETYDKLRTNVDDETALQLTSKIYSNKYNKKNISKIFSDKARIKDINKIKEIIE